MDHDRADLERRLAEAEDTLDALRRQEVDAVVGGKDLLLLRLREIEGALRAGEQRYRIALAAGRMGTWEWDPATDIVDTDPMLRELWGLEGDEPRRPRAELTDRMHAQDRAAFPGPESADALDGRVDLGFRVVDTGGGGVRWLEGAAMPLRDEAGAVAGVIGVCFDVTARVEAERDLRSARDELEQRVAERTAELQQRADQLGRLTTELTQTEQRERQRLARILHDHLQQLLVSAKMNIDGAERPDPERRAAALAHIRACIDEAIAASRSLSVELSPPILAEGGLAAGFDWLARRMRDQHGLAVEVEADPDANPRRDDVRTLLFESVREMLFNIVKHSGVTEARVVMDAPDPRRVRVTVADHGRGFDPQVLLGEREAGAGFGLFRIRERLALLGGSFEIDSAPGRGARFVLCAPRDADANADPARTAQAPAAPADEPAPVDPDADGRIRVLIADDHAVIRSALRSMLADQDAFEVVGEAGDGLEAVAQAHALRPDLVLMDFSMPRLDGVEATRRVRQELPGVHVIGLSMYEESERAQAMIDAGASGYVSKSDDSDVLIRRIHAVHDKPTTG